MIFLVPGTVGVLREDGAGYYPFTRSVIHRDSLAGNLLASESIAYVFSVIFKGFNHS